MAYTKPQVIAQNAKSGSYAAGCPAKNTRGFGVPECKDCERTMQFALAHNRGNAGGFNQQAFMAGAPCHIKQDGSDILKKELFHDQP